MRQADVDALIDFTLAYTPRRIESCFERLFSETIDPPPMHEDPEPLDWQARELARRDRQLEALYEQRDSIDLAIQALESLLAHAKTKLAGTRGP